MKSRCNSNQLIDVVVLTDSVMQGIP